MAILTVGSHGAYSSITAAMRAAHAQDTISLQSGYHGEYATVTVNNIFVSGGVTSTGIHLKMGAGVDVLTLQGLAPIAVRDNAGNNVITGNAGANIIEVSGGIDVVHGGAGNDRLIVDYSTVTSDIIGTSVHVTDGGTHSVTFNGIENFTINTGSGDDTITSGDGSNVFNTRAGNDTITSGNGHNYVNAGYGNDTVTVGDGGNQVLGGAGNDTITSGNGNDTLIGDTGNDTISGGGGNDVLNGGDGNDTLSGGAGNDILIGGRGNNIMHGGTGIDTANYAQSTLAVDVHLAIAVIQAVNTVESDTLVSIENVVGSAYNDTLIGSSVNNVITGGLGADNMNGGGGADTFHYASVNESTSMTHDTITGFNASADKFDLWFAVTGVNSAVTSGSLSSASFNSDLSSAIGASQLGAHHAVLFTAHSGSFAGDTFLVVDANGVAGYQAGHDLVIELTGGINLSGLSTADFI